MNLTVYSEYVSIVCNMIRVRDRENKGEILLLHLLKYTFVEQVEKYITMERS